MQRIVYILGAGFSAPLGLPVIRNFIEVSKDLYFGDKRKFQGFEKVFDQIRDMSAVKNYYKADMFDIEEVLSILDLRVFAGEVEARNEFIDYVRTVIKEKTPKIFLAERTPQDSRRSLTESKLSSAYAYFVLELFGFCPAFQFTGRMTEKMLPYVEPIRPEPEAAYNVVTLNYDRVLEDIAALFLNGNHPLKFRQDEGMEDGVPILAKLHGSVDGEIIPPTWRKGNETGVGKEWGKAIRILRQANYIRFIGYSLPPTDSYIRYLLKAAVIDAPNLKGIDIISLDSTGTLEARYREFLAHHNVRFKLGDVKDYLMLLMHGGNDPTQYHSNLISSKHPLEQMHEKFMS